MPRIRAPRRLRTTFAFKLLVAGLVLSVVLIGSVSVFLFVSRDQQTRQAAQSNAVNRAVLLRQLIQKVSEPQARFAVEAAAGLHSLRIAIAATDPATSVTALFTNQAVPLLPDDYVAIFDKSGKALYSSESPGVPHMTAGLATVTSALKGSGLEGVEILGKGNAVFDTAVPVFDDTDKTKVVGAVVYSAPLSLQLARFAPAATYPTAFVPADGSNLIYRVSDDPKSQNTLVTPGTLPSELQSQAVNSAGADSISAFYTAPGLGEVAGDFVSLAGPSQKTAGYVGVELPLAEFAASGSKDKWTVVLIGLTAVAVTALAVVVFVNRFVRRPVSTLQRGVARIASGDYTTDIPVISEDELGDLATSVNRMRLQIASYIRHIDGAVARLSDVSRALTTTATGIETLQRAVLTAASGMVGGTIATALYGIEEDHLSRVAAMPADSEANDIDDTRAAALMNGDHVRWRVGESYVLVVPMYYQEKVVGALMTVTAKETQESDERALVALANNATIALENTRLFEQERETVARLRELDAMKSDFLSNVQHELRTPVMAIMGQIELMTVGWDQWDEAMKRDLMKDMEIYTRQLKQIVDVMIDFSLFSSETLQLKQGPVDVKRAIDAVIAETTEGFKGKLPVNVRVEIPDDLYIQADAARFGQVIQALLDNSVKFTAAGGNVRIRAVAADGVARIEVQDNGIGIAEEALPRIFEQFYQADSSKTRTFGGLGMGLSLVERLTQAHGAKVEVISKVGEGSLFTLVWPLAQEAAAAAPAQEGGFHFFDAGTKI